MAKKDVMKELEKLFKEKLGIGSDAFKELVEKENVQMREALPDADDTLIQKRVLAQLRSDFKSQLRSPAKTYEGFLFSIENPFDIIASTRAAAIELFKTDPDKAVDEGFTDDNGIPLDTREAIGSRPNNNFGKPLPENEFLQNVKGVAKDEDGNLWPFKMILGNQLAGKIDIPVFKWSSFRANLSKKSPAEGFRLLNPYSRIVFDVADAPDSDFDVILEDIEGDLEGHAIELGAIETYFDQVADDNQRFTITMGDVAFIARDERGGSRMMVLDDETRDIEDPGIVCFIPEYLFDAIDFGQGSRVIVCGRPNLSTYNDEERVVIQVTGLYAPEESKIPADESPMNAVERVN